jgi:hypothetical protein
MAVAGEAAASNPEKMRAEVAADPPVRPEGKKVVRNWRKNSSKMRVITAS